LGIIRGKKELESEGANESSAGKKSHSRGGGKDVMQNGEGEAKSEKKKNIDRRSDSCTEDRNRDR